MQQVQIGQLTVAIQRSAQRRTITLTVERDGSIVARVPAQCSNESLRETLRRKELWIHDALERHRQGTQPTPIKQFISGEGFHYLGHSYRLRVKPTTRIQSDIPPLRLSRSHFLLRADCVLEARGHFLNWYISAGEQWMCAHLSSLQNRAGVKAQGIRVIDLGFKWASCSENGWLNFHWRAFLLPAPIITYLTLHELCHLLEHNHSPQFWELVARVD
ncbi:MAG TPA: SprT family zinc-dependent metalloprotease, partial [Abditibacteriaceae bacterium]